MPGQANNAKQLILSTEQPLRNLIEICDVVAGGFVITAPGGNTFTLNQAQQTALLNRYDNLRNGFIALAQNLPVSSEL